MKKVLLLVLILAASVFSKEETAAIEKYLDKISVGDPIEYKNLKIFPLTVQSALSTVDYITLDQAMDKGWLKIKESGEGEVNTVMVKNNGDAPVFLLTGEMITGAKQDRMLEKDLLLPSNSGWVEVPVYCVEHGRWVSVSPEFKSGGYVVPNAVRQAAKINPSQSEVWDKVAENQEQLGVASGTGTARDTYEDSDVQKRLDDYEVNLGKIPKLSSTTIGVVVTTGDRMICFDMFANNGLLKKLWKKLVKSYAMDALTGEKSSLTKSDIRELLEVFEDARFVSTGTPGLGDLFTIESTVGKGSALTYGKAVVHMDFFPSEDLPTDDDGDGLRLDFRRDQRNGE